MTSKLLNFIFSLGFLILFTDPVYPVSFVLKKAGLKKLIREIRDIMIKDPVVLYL